MKAKKGISLIVLVITIIVIIILAGAVILSLQNNNPINTASEATARSNKSELQSGIALYLANLEGTYNGAKLTITPTSTPTDTAVFTVTPAGSTAVIVKSTDLGLPANFFSRLSGYSWNIDENGQVTLSVTGIYNNEAL